MKNIIQVTLLLLVMASCKHGFYSADKGVTQSGIRTRYIDKNTPRKFASTISHMKWCQNNLSDDFNNMESAASICFDLNTDPGKIGICVNDAVNGELKLSELNSYILCKDQLSGLPKPVEKCFQKMIKKFKNTDLDTKEVASAVVCQGFKAWDIAQPQKTCLKYVMETYSHLSPLAMSLICKGHAPKKNKLNCYDLASSNNSGLSDLLIGVQCKGKAFEIGPGSYDISSCALKTQSKLKKGVTRSDIVSAVLCSGAEDVRTDAYKKRLSCFLKYKKENIKSLDLAVFCSQHNQMK